MTSAWQSFNDNPFRISFRMHWTFNVFHFKAFLVIIQLITNKKITSVHRGCILAENWLLVVNISDPVWKVWTHRLGEELKDANLEMKVVCVFLSLLPLTRRLKGSAAAVFFLSSPTPPRLDVLGPKKEDEGSSDNIRGGSISTTQYCTIPQASLHQKKSLWLSH